MNSILALPARISQPFLLRKNRCKQEQSSCCTAELLVLLVTEKYYSFRQRFLLKKGLVRTRDPLLSLWHGRHCATRRLHSVHLRANRRQVHNRQKILHLRLLSKLSYRSVLSEVIKPLLFNKLILSSKVVLVLHSPVFDQIIYLDIFDGFLSLFHYTIYWPFLFPLSQTYVMVTYTSYRFSLSIKNH